MQTTLMGVQNPLKCSFRISYKFFLQSPVMLLGIVSSDGDVMPQICFDQNFRVNAIVYTEELNTLLKPCIIAAVRKRPYI